MNASKVLIRLALFAVLAIGLGAYIWTVERPRMAEESADDLLIDFEPGQVTELRLVYANRPPYILKRESPDSEWQILEPLRARADGPTVDRLLDQIAQAKAERRISPEEAEAPEIYGLEGDGQRARVSIRLADGTELPDIVVGRTTPVNYLAFARVEGEEEILVTPLIFHTGVHKTLLELRDKSLFDFPVDSVVAFEIVQTAVAGEGADAGPATLRVVRGDSGWEIVEPFGDRADDEPVRALLSSVATMQALDFYAQGSSQVEGLSPPIRTLEITLKDGQKTGLKLGAPTPGQPAGFFIERTPDGLLAKGPEWLPASVTPDPAPLRDRHLFTCGSDDVAAITVRRPQTPEFTIVIEGDQWRMNPGSDRELRQDVAARRIAALTDLRGETMVVEPRTDASANREPDSPESEELPGVVIELTGNDGRSCGSLRAVRVDRGDGSPPVLYLERLSDGAIFSAPEHVFSRTDLYAEDFLMPQQPSAVRPDGSAEAGSDRIGQ